MELTIRDEPFLNSSGDESRSGVFLLEFRMLMHGRHSFLWRAGVRDTESVGSRAGMMITPMIQTYLLIGMDYNSNFYEKETVSLSAM